MTKKHANIEQLDGTNADMEKVEEDDKLEETCLYWKTGRLGTIYQTFLDVNKIIDECNLPEDVKKDEKAKVLDARKLAFGSDFQRMPPWRNW